MPIRFPAPGVGGERWARRSAGAQVDYRNGIQAAAGTWQPAATAAEANYKTGVTAAAAAGNYGKGINKAGDAKWVARASTLGPDRFAQGVQVAQPLYEAGVGPIWQRVSAMTLPPKGPRGAAQNYQRPALVAQEMRKAAGR